MTDGSARAAGASRQFAQETQERGVHLRRPFRAGAGHAAPASLKSTLHHGPKGARVVTSSFLSVRKREGRPLPDAVASLNFELAARFGNRFSASEAIRQQHGHTLTWLENQPPDSVVFAETREDAVDLVKICARHDAPIIPFGTGSSLEGHVNAPYGGVSLDLSRMNHILAVNAEDLDCVVEPGVTRTQLNAWLHDSGLFFPIDPGADASLGGMASTRASGTNAVRYGTMKDLVLSLGVVTADGTFLRTGTRAKKSAAGYDLTRLFVGAEGTLGVVVEVTLKLSGLPEAVSAATCSFPDVRSACNTTIETIQSGLPIARIELLDTLSVRAFNAYSHLSLPEAPMLIVEFHGTDSGVVEQARRFYGRLLDADVKVARCRNDDLYRDWATRGRIRRPQPVTGRSQLCVRPSARRQRRAGDACGTQPVRANDGTRCAARGNCCKDRATLRHPL